MAKTQAPAFSPSRLPAVPRMDAARFDEHSYMSLIARYPVLEQEHEEQLARRWAQDKDQSAADILVTSHLRLSAKLARRYRGYGFALGDLIAEGNLGLVMALNRYDPDRGARFSTCAVWWIKSAIYDYVMRSWSLVRLGRTPAQKKLFFRLRGEMQRLQPNRSGALTNDVAQQISRSLGVPIDDVLEMEQRLSGDLSLNAPLSGLDDAAEWQDIIADDSPNIETLLAANDERDRQRAALTDALSVLDDRERKIFAARHLRERPESFEQIGQSLSISAERVRQLEARAYTKVASAARRVCKGLQALPQPSAALPARRAPLPRLVNAAATPAFA
jgi:RNA polymerase sigma-32 factor